MGLWQLSFEKTDLWHLAWLGAISLGVLLVSNQRWSFAQVLRTLAGFGGIVLIAGATQWWPAWIGLSIVIISGWEIHRRDRTKESYRQCAQDLIGAFLLWVSSWLGSDDWTWTLFVSGLLVLSRAFPWTGWVHGGFNDNSSSLLSRHVFPGWALLCWGHLNLKLHPGLDQVGVIPMILLGTAMMTSFIACLQTGPMKVVQLAIRSQLVFSIAILLSFGFVDAMRFWCGTTVGLTQLYSILFYLDSNGRHQKTGLRIALVGLGAVAVQVTGMASTGLFASGLAPQWIVGLGLGAAVLTKLIRNVWTERYRVIPGRVWLVWVVLGFASIAPAGAWLDIHFFQIAETALFDSIVWDHAAIQMVPAITVGALLGFLLPKNIQTKWFTEIDPMDVAANGVFNGVRKVSTWIQSIRLKVGVFNRFPLFLWRAATVVQGLEQRSVFRIEKWASGLLRSGGSALQAIQNGNLQWYLFFAIGSGVALLIHFLKLGTA